MFTIVTLGTFVLRKMQIIQRKSYIHQKQIFTISNQNNVMGFDFIFYLLKHDNDYNYQLLCFNV